MIPVNKRKIVVCILLSIVTLGIYQIYWQYLLVKNTRAIQEDNSSCIGEMLCLMFVPFYSLLWWFTRGKIIRLKFAKQGRPAIGSEIAYLILSIFGFTIISMAIMQTDFNSLRSESTLSIRHMTSDNTILEVVDLYKSFGNTSVLNGVSFSLKKGEVLSVIGSSGGGKTTLLRCLNFLEKADSGTIRVAFHATAGEKAEVSDDAQSSFGLVFQQFNLFPQYNVIENLMLAPKLRAKREKTYTPKLAEEIRSRATKLLATVGLSEKENAYPCELSGGQQQRVAIARALMLSPEILCFDEPTSALDPELTGEVLKAIRALRSSDRTMIIVTHEMEFARNVSDKVIFMADGLIEEMGTPEEVFNHPRSKKTKAFLGRSRDAASGL